MNKIAIFVEGQAELVFIRRIICQLFAGTQFSFECFKLHKGNMQETRYKLPNPVSDRHFLLVNVEGDEKVLSAIKEREKSLFEKGYSRVIGMRDMYGESYINRAGREINPDINRLFVDKTQDVIQLMSYPEKIAVYFAIMEIEAWWLAMPSIFSKIDPSLTCEKIHEYLDFRLDLVDPETFFFHPANNLKDILGIVDRRYTKSLDDAEMITEKVEVDDLLKILEEDKCSSFKRLLNDLLDQ